MSPERLSFRKYSAIVVGVSVVLSMAVAVGAVALYEYERLEVVDRITAAESGRVKHQAQALRDDLQRAISDLRELAGSEITRRFLDNPGPETSRAVQDQFLLTTRTSGLYDQIRIINSDGVEAVRVNYNGGEPAPVPTDQLQDKKGRYYFRAALGLGRRGIYVSRFDLNMEQGRIEKPLKPVLRFATPLFDSKGVKKGILIENYLGAGMLDRFTETAFGQGGAQAMLLDAEGYWLKAARQSNEWGFMFGSDRTFARSFPQAWKAVTSRQEGRYEDASGLLFFDTVHLQALGARPDGLTVCSGARFWKVLSLAPPGAVGRRIATGAWGMVAACGLLIGFVVSTGLAMIRSRLRDDRYINELQSSEQTIASLNELLELEIANRTSEIRRLLIQKDAFMTQLGHDLRTPLTPMVALLPLLRKRLNPESAGILDPVIEGVSNIRKLVENTLALVRLNTPGCEPDFTNIDLLVETRNMTAIFRQELADNSIAVDNRITAATLIRADRVKIRDVLHQIISNCIKHMGPAGTITISANSSSTNMVTVSIHDTGAGMSPKEISLAFDEFYKADPSRHDRSATGLGLAICKRIVEMHGGRIWIQSSGIDQGTTVFLMLPAGKEAPAG